MSCLSLANGTRVPLHNGFVLGRVAGCDLVVDDTKAFGVPTIRLDSGHGPAIFGPVVSEMPTDEDAIALFEHVVWLVRYPNFGELKRDRIDLDVPSAAAWRARQAAKAAAAQADAAG